MLVEGGEWEVGEDGAKVGLEKKGVAEKPHAVVHLRAVTALYSPKDIEWLPVVQILLAGSVVGVLNMLKLAPPESSLPRGMIYVANTFKCSFLSLTLPLCG